MYRRDSLVKKKKAKKKRCERTRNRILNFRVSEEELKSINKNIELLAMKKQDYFIQLLTNHEVIVNADYRIYDNISKEIFRLALVIKKFGNLEKDDSDILKNVLKIYDSIRKEKDPNYGNN